jgi:hypothetical protein
MRPAVELAVRAMIRTRDLIARLPQVVRFSLGFRLTGLL